MRSTKGTQMVNYEFKNRKLGVVEEVRASKIEKNIIP